MSRLTKRNEYGEAFFPKCFERCDGEPEKCEECITDAENCERLCQYEEEEERKKQGRALVITLAAVLGGVAGVLIAVGSSVWKK